MDLDLQECKEVDVTSHLHSPFLFFITRRKVPAHSFVTKVQLVDLANGIKILGHLKFAAARK